MVDPKTFLSLAMPNQYCLDDTKLMLSYFGMNFWGKKLKTFMIPIYGTTVLNNTLFLSYFTFYSCFVCTPCFLRL